MATEPAIVHGWSSFLAATDGREGEVAPGDHLQSAYKLWLSGHQLESGRVPWEDPYSFRPEAKPQVNAAWWPFGLAYWPLDRALGQVRAWNLFVLLGFLGAGGLACAWLRSLGLARGAALAGGLVFAAAPYRVLQSVGPLLGATSMLLPLSLWGFERRRWWISRVALVSIPLSGQVHLAIGAIGLYVLYAACRSQNRRVLTNAALGAIAAVLAGLFIRLTVIGGSIEEGGRSLDEVRAYSADWLDFVVRSPRDGIETFVFIGWLTPLAAAAGLALLVLGGRRRLAIGLAVAALVPLLLALGTTTPVYEVLWNALPPLRYPRVPARLLPVACLALAALAAVVVAVALRLVRDRRVQYAVVGAAVVLFAADLHVREVRAADPDPDNRAYAELRKLPGRLVELPATLPDNQLGSVYLYYARQVRKQRLLGYSTTAPQVADAVARRLRGLSCGDWTGEGERALARYDVGAIALHGGLSGDRAWLAWRGLIDHGWSPRVTDGAVTAFARGETQQSPPFPEPRADDLVFCAGWYGPDARGRQMAQTHTAFWVYGEGFIRLFVTAPRPLTVRVRVDGREHSRPRITSLTELRIALRGPNWHLITFDARKLPVVGGESRGLRLLAYSLP